MFFNHQRLRLMSCLRQKNSVSLMAVAHNAACYQRSLHITDNVFFISLHYGIERCIKGKLLVHFSLYRITR